MSRQIIVLDANNNVDATSKTLTLRCAFWLTPPANRTVPTPNSTTQVPPSSAVNPNTGVTWGYTAAELAAIQSGAVVEQVASVAFDLTLSTPTLAQMETSAIAKWTALQTALTNSAFSVAHVVGASYDGTSWTGGP